MPQTKASAHSTRQTLGVCTEYPVRQHGGTEVLVRELIDGLVPHYRLVLVSDDEPGVLDDSRFRGKVEQHFRWNPANAAPETSTEIARQLKNANVQLAHFHFGGNFGWNARRPHSCPIVHLDRSGVPCLSTNHGVFGLLDGYIGPQRSIVTKLALLPAAWLAKMQVLSHLRAEVAVSRNDCSVLRRRYWPVQSKFRQIYHSRIREHEIVEGMPREKIVLCAGTIGPRKGQPFLAHAFLKIAAGVPEWNLMFVGRPGDAASGAQLQTIIDVMPARILWQQDCPDAELKRWFQRAEVFAMPSLHEGLGLSLQEALFYGCACVASSVGGIRDLITDGDNGMLVRPADSAALAQALNRLLNDDDLRARFRRRSRPSVIEKDMTAERMVRQHLILYETVLMGTERNP